MAPTRRTPPHRRSHSFSRATRSSASFRDRQNTGAAVLNAGEREVDFLYADMTQASFWVAVFQIIVVNIILSGDNAVVIALACMHLPPKQRLWGMILGAGVAVLLRILFTLVVAQAMGYPYLKLVGGLLLLWVAVKLVSEDADGGDDDKV